MSIFPKISDPHHQSGERRDAAIPDSPFSGGVGGGGFRLFKTESIKANANVDLPQDI